MAKPGEVQHVNLIAGWDNPKQHEVFCRKEHAIKPVTLEKCEQCPYFVTMGRMDAVICQWKDTLAAGNYTTKVIRMEDSKNELLRVSALIDNGVLKR